MAIVAIKHHTILLSHPPPNPPKALFHLPLTSTLIPPPSNHITASFSYTYRISLIHIHVTEQLRALDATPLQSVFEQLERDRRQVRSGEDCREKRGVEKKREKRLR
jgi:hypothetical protein